MSIVNIRDVGAVGDGRTNDTDAIQKAIDTTAENGGGTILFPAGTYATGTVYLKSNITIQLTAGATWMGFPDPDLYPMIEPAMPSRMDTTPWRAFIYAAHQENITLCGEGRIFPNGGADCFLNGKGNSPERPYGLHIIGCRNVAVKDLRLEHSAFWMQRYLACDGLLLSGLKVYNHVNINNDGSDIDSCRNVVVDNCRIDASDDALCFKSEGADPCENVTVTNCILSSFASAIKFGTASIGGFKRFTISNCVVRPSVATNMTHGCGAYGGLMGIDLGNVDGGVLENILISNIVMEGVETPIYIKLGNRNSRSDRGGEWKDAPPPREGRTRRVRVDNVLARDVGPIASAIVGYPGNAIEDLTLTRIDIETGKATKQDVSDEVEVHESLYPFNRIFNSDLPAYGFYIRHVNGVILSDVRLKPAEGDKRPAIWLEDSKDVTFYNVDGKVDPSCPEAIVQRNTE